MIQIGVFGAGGRMGQTVCAAVAGDPELQLVAAIDPAHAGETVEGKGIVADPAAIDVHVDVVIDFTHVDAARSNLHYAADQGVHAVVGRNDLSAVEHYQLCAFITP